MRYTNNIKYIHIIGIPTTCGYHNVSEKTGFNVGAMFAQYYFALDLFQIKTSNFTMRTIILVHYNL